MSDAKLTKAIIRLRDIMASLRDPISGCPWDKVQTMQSLTRFTIEEAYEAVDAITSGESDAIKDELGDLLFQIVFYGQIGAEQGTFDLADIANAISDKMIRRHPHVFAGQTIDQGELADQWDAIKASEKANKKNGSLLDDVPVGLPALMYAQKIQKRCAKVGFDWNNTEQVFAKVKEEIGEIEQELNAPSLSKERVEDEIGDAFFALVNLCRHANVDADTALRKASSKFKQRFDIVETLATQDQQSLQELSLPELENLWVKAKKQHSA